MNALRLSQMSPPLTPSVFARHLTVTGFFLFVHDRCAEHLETMRPIPTQLFHQSKLPVEIGLHGLSWIVGSFVRTAVAVDRL